MAKKAARKAKGRTTPSKKKKGGGARAAARTGAGPRRKTARKTGRKTARAKTPRGKAARKQAKTPPRRARSTKLRAGRPTKLTTGKRKTAQGKKASRTAKARPRRGGTGMERELSQTPNTGRSVKGPTNPWPTVRSTGTPAGAGDTRRSPRLERERKQLRELDETVASPPSSLNIDAQRGSAARTGRAELQQARREHTETGPALTGGDVDADWGDAYAVGDEAPGGDNPTPDQDIVDDIGKALGVQYEDNEELKAADKIIERDRHRWELDPASSEDYKDRDKEE